MKLIKLKLLQKADYPKRRIGKYQITLELTDTDINMFENLTYTYAPFQLSEDLKTGKVAYEKFNNECDKLDFTNKYHKWLMKVCNILFKCWRYD